MTFEKLSLAVSALKSDAKWQKLCKGRPGTGEIACPACLVGRIKYSVAASNGHMIAKCSTDKCVKFVE